MSGSKKGVTMGEVKKEFITLPLSDIHPYKNNPRVNDDAVDDVVESIKQCHDLDPIEIDEDNVILSGHTRLKALQRLNYTTADCLRYTGLTDAQKRKYRILANKASEKSKWDLNLLPLELEGLDFEGYDFDFDLPDIDLNDNTDVIEDEPPEVADDFAKTGDLWLLGEHRLLCGDCTDAENIKTLMDGNKADMVFTDPPYGVAIGDKNKTLNSVQKAGRCCENISGDTMSEDELYEMLKKAFINVRENCKDDASYYVTSPQGGSLGLMMMMMMKDAGLTVRHVLMWMKNTATFSLGRLDYDYQHEPIFYTWTKKHKNYRGVNFALLYGRLINRASVICTLQ